MLRWKKKYGNIFTCYIGRKRVIVLSNFETIRKVFIDNATTGRDQDRVMPMPSGEDGEYGLIFSQGDLWTLHRRFTLTALHALSKGSDWLEDIILTEIEFLLNDLARTHKTPTNPYLNIKSCVANVILTQVFGRSFNRNNRKFNELVELLALNMQGVSMEFLASAFPVLLHIPGSVREVVKGAKKQRLEIFRRFKELTTEHIITFLSGEEDNNNGQVKCYIDAFRTEQKKLERSNSDKAATFNEEQMTCALYDLFGAGSEPLTSSILWTFVFLLENPEVQRKLQSELTSKFEPSHVIKTTDRVLLPYMEAVIMEVQRCASIVPLAVPHQLLDDMTIEGYDIPKNTLIIPNCYAIHRDTRFWTNPESFDPSRFLDEDGKVIGRSPLGYVPFSTGKRLCMGEELARMELFLITANILNRFLVKLPPGVTISHDDYSSSVVRYPKPFNLIFLTKELTV